MTIVGFARLTSAVLAVLAVLSSAITYVPAPWHPEVVVPGGLALGAVLAGLLAFLLRRLPKAHWVHRSDLAWVYAAVAVIIIAALALVG